MTIAVYARNTKDNHPDYLEQLQQLSIKEHFIIVVYKAYQDF